MRKTVTVLFADLGGSTGFGERTDAEIARQVLARYHALLQETIDAHGGTVAKFMGDGMMATFGIPEVAEDDARRAVDAGAALQQRFAEFAVDIEQRHHETLTLRVGVNTGEVVIGEGDADLVGDALNVAARLEKACRPSRVLVGEETWRLTRSTFAYEALGEVAVAGRAQPVAIYELLAAERAEEVAAPFVGREREMDRLLAVLDDARAASGAKLTTVLGSPGVGKTRLARELCARAAERDDARSVELRCDRAGEATFAPIAQLLRDSAAIGDDADADAVRTAIDTLLSETEADRARVVDVLAALVGVGAARSVEETFWGVRRLVATTAADRPLVVVIDDIQWAEPLLLDLLEHLAEWVRDAAVLLVGLARPELRELRPAFAEPGRSVAAVVVLDGLDPSATEALAAGLLGTERLPAGLVERLPSSTDGNPLFVRELVRMLVDDEVIRRRDDGEWELTIDADAVDVPPTIQSLLGARVERLPAAERQLLEYASVIGAEFSLGALRELAGAYAPIATVPIASLLEAMRRKELVEPTGTYWGDEPVHRFHHVLIRDAAYRRLLKTARAELHERVAVWTDRTAADMVGEHEAATAFHYEQAYRYRAELGTVDDHTEWLGRRAAELLTIGAQRALGRDDLASAGALSARALALLPETDTAARSDLLMMGCECLLAAADGAAARPLVEELGRSTAGDPRLAAWAECYAAQLVGLIDPEGLVTADATAQAAAVVLTELGDGSGQAKAHQVRALLLARLGRVGDAEQELDLALAAARTADDRRRVTAVLGAAPDAALFGPSPVARAGGRCLDVVRLLRITTASPAVEAASNRCQAVLEALRGRFDVARSMLASARAALEDLGLRHGLAQTEQYAGMVELISGDPHAAIPHLRAAFSGLGALGVGADAGNAAALLARALLVDGNVDEADQMATASERLAGQNLKTAIGWRVARAEVLAARGDLVGAVAIAERAAEIAAGTDLVVDHADACATLATVRARAGDAARASAARADARRLYEQKGATAPAERLDPDEAPPQAPRAPRSPGGDDQPETRSENGATRTFAAVVRLATSRRFDEIASSVTNDFARIDRRSAVAAPVARDAETWVAAWRSTIGSGLDQLAVESLAVRGERLALQHLTFTSAGGDQVPMFGVIEVDEADRICFAAWHDDDALAAAVEELETRYVASEGAAYGEQLRAASAHSLAVFAREWDAVAATMADDFVAIDHRGLWPELDRDGHLARARTLIDQAPDSSVVSRSYQFAGPAMLATCDVRGTGDQGDSFTYTYHLVAVTNEAGLATRFEYFDDADLDAAIVRLGELSGAGSRAPIIETAATRSMEQFPVLARARRFDAMTDLIADDYIRVDHRRGVPAPTAHGPDDFVELIRATLDVGFDEIRNTPIAVRGERVALSRVDVHASDGREISFLQVHEWDESKLVYAAHFEEDDLDAALDELDARYAAGEGAAHADLIATNRAWLRAMNTRDHEALRSLAAPDFEFVDRRPLGAPRLDLAGFTAWQEGYRDVAGALIAVDVRFGERANLVTVLNRAIDPDGGEIVWPMLSVGVFDGAARARCIEIFAPEQWDAALARFDELAEDSPVPRIENAATRSFEPFLARLNAQDFDGVGELVADGIIREDRRSVVGAGHARGRGEYLAAVRAIFDAGYSALTWTWIAIRGDRLALCRPALRSAAGDESEFLVVGEIDATGRIAHMVNFDLDDLDGAMDELDGRYAAGEGAAHADLIATNRAWFRALNTHDHEAMRALVAPGFQYVDHRPVVGTPPLDLDGFLAYLDGYRDVAFTGVVVNLRLRDRAVLVTAVNRARDANGGEIAWTFHAVGAVDNDGRNLLVEQFAEEQWDAALARFDELTVLDSRTARAENTVTRWRRIWDGLVEAGRFDEIRTRVASGEFFAEGYVRVDRRPGVAAPDADADTVIDSLVALFDLGLVQVSVEHLAVRGEWLVLSRQSFRSAGGDEMVLLNLTELDATERCVFTGNYSEEQLADALEELTERYLAGEGAEHGDVVRAALRVNRAFDEDPDALADLCTPDFSLDDHRLLFYGSGDAEYLATIRRASPDDHVDRTVTVNRKLLVEGRALLTMQDLHREDPGGAEYRWSYAILAVFDAALRLRRLEWFDEDDWSSALARFDELAVGVALPPALENAVTRLNSVWVEAKNAGRSAELEHLIAPGYTVVSHRFGGVVPASEGVDQMRELSSAGDDVGFVTQTIEPVAVRGDRIAILRLVATTADGYVSERLEVSELDVLTRFARTEIFDAADVAGAIALLDEWYAAGESAEHAPVIKLASDFVRSMASLDGEATLALVHPDARFTDHRRLGYGSMGFDGVRRLLTARAEQLVEDTSYFADLTVRGDTMMGLFVSVGVGPDGADVLYEGQWVARWVAGTMLDIDWYDPADIDAARARFDELTAELPRALEIENAAAAVARQIVRLLDEGRVDEVRALLHQDLVVESRRWHAGAPQPVDLYVDSLRVMREQYDSFAGDCVAVRGDRLQVQRVRANDDAGNELDAAVAIEVDESRRVIRLVNFDADDEVAAIELLDEWYIEGEGAADADSLRANREFLHSYHARDWTGLRERMAPDFEFVDHRPLPWPLSDADGLIRLMQERIEQVPDLRSRIRKLWVQGRAALSVGEAIGSDEQGGLQRWPLLTVWVLDAAGTTRRIEYFAPEQLDAALVRFDELAAGAVDPRHPWIENAATRIVPRATRLYEAGRRDDTAALFAEDFRRIDRRTTVSFPDMGKAEYLEWHQSAYDQFDTISFQPLAVRGEQLCLFRVVMARDGFESVFGMLVQLDDEGLIAEYVNFDENDLAAAQDDLDGRFIAGEGAPYAELLRAGTALTDAYVAKDTAAVATMRAPGFTFTDHRRFGWEGPERLAAFDDLDESFLVTKYLLRSNAMLGSVVNRGVDPRGNNAEWLLHVVTAVDGESRFSSTDWYDADDWDAALARFDELVAPADPRHPRAENATTQLNDRFVMLVEAGRTAEAGMVADDYVRVDRRSTIAAPNSSGSGQYADALAAALDVGFTSYRVTPIAVRGERLALSRVVMTTNDGFEMRFLVFDESGDDGRALRSVYFDDDDLVTAVEALELRDRDLSGDAYSEVERAYVDRILAVNRADGLVQCQVKRYLSPRAVISVVPIRGATPGRRDIVWQDITVERFDRDSLVAADHRFQIEQWDEALALFDEWSADVVSSAEPGVVLENAAVRALARLADAFAARDGGRMAALYPDDAVNEDRRTGVNSGVSVGRDAITELRRGLESVGFTSVVHEVLAVRGEHLALARRCFTGTDGFDLELLTVLEVDADERHAVSVLFDADDLAAAQQELDARYLASGGAASAS